MNSLFPWHKYTVAHCVLERTKTDNLVPDKNLTWLNPSSGIVESVGPPTSFKFQYKELEFKDLLDDSEFDTESLMKAKKLLHTNKHIEIKIKNKKEILKITADGKIAIENEQYIKERNKMIIATIAIISGIISIVVWIK